MSNVSIVPLQPTPQRISIALGSVTYQLTFKYRNIDGGGWIMDIATNQGVPILSGIPLVTGVDLLAQYKYLNFGGGLYVQTIGSPDLPPTFDNLGIDGLVYWVTP